MEPALPTAALRGVSPLKLQSSPFQVQFTKEGEQFDTHDNGRHMILPELDDIICKYNDRYKHLTKYGDGHQLIKETTPRSRVTELEGRLKLVLPKEFVDMTTSYRFSSLVLGGLCFITDKDSFQDIYEENVDPPVTELFEYGWWRSGSENRPRHLISIAFVDVHQVLLDVDSGNVLSYCSGEETWKDSYKIADDFALLVRGAAYAALMINLDDSPNRILAKELEDAVGAEPNHNFWVTLT